MEARQKPLAFLGSIFGFFLYFKFFFKWREKNDQTVNEIRCHRYDPEVFIYFYNLAHVNESFEILEARINKHYNYKAYSKLHATRLPIGF